MVSIVVSCLLLAVLLIGHAQARDLPPLRNYHLLASFLSSRLAAEDFAFSNQALYHDALKRVRNQYCGYFKPMVVIQASSAATVEVAIAASKHAGVGIAVLGGGHSYGCHSSTTGILVDMSRQKSVCIDYKNQTVEIGGGALWLDFYDALAPSSRLMIPGGQCPSVGVAGYTTGGGVSPFTRSIGMAIDALLCATVVLANETTVRVCKDAANPFAQNLFWALRGGGAGSFGVVMSLQYKMQELRTTNVVAGEICWLLDKPSQQSAWERWLTFFNDWDATTLSPYTALYMRVRFKNGALHGCFTIIHSGPSHEGNAVVEAMVAHSPELVNVTSQTWRQWAHIQNAIHGDAFNAQHTRGSSHSHGFFRFPSASYYPWFCQTARCRDARLSWYDNTEGGDIPKMPFPLGPQPDKQFHCMERYRLPVA